VLDFIGLFHSVEMTPHLLYAASRRTDDAIEILEILDKELLRGFRVVFVSTVGHRLPAACLIQRVTHIEPESFEELKSSHPNLGINHVDIARYEEADSHVSRTVGVSFCFDLCCHL
jgi:hypothetical protein